MKDQWQNQVEVVAQQRAVELEVAAPQRQQHVDDRHPLEREHAVLVRRLGGAEGELLRDRVHL